MRLRRGPHLASVAFCVVIALAVVALSWGVSHNGRSSHGLGTAAQQAAASSTLATGLVLPAGLVRDKTFTACGTTAGATCLTSTADIPGALMALAAPFKTAGGKLGTICATAPVATPSGGVTVPSFSCAVEGQLDGAWVLFLLGSGWQLPPTPGHATPRTAVLATVERVTSFSSFTEPGAPPTVGPLLPANWAGVPQPCASTSSPVASSPVASSAPASSAPASSAPASSAPALPGSVLPPCTPHVATDAVAAPVAVLDAARQLSTTALAQGFRLDGKPCVTDPAVKGCAVWGERISAAGVQTELVATLDDNGHGSMIGTLTLTDQS